MMLSVSTILMALFSVLACQLRRICAAGIYVLKPCAWLLFSQTQTRSCCKLIWSSCRWGWRMSCDTGCNGNVSL